MKTLSLSEAKMKLSALVNSLKIAEEEVVINKNGRLAAVLVSPGKFKSWRETITVMSDHDLMNEIREGLSALRKKKVRLYTLKEIFE